MYLFGKPPNGSGLSFQRAKKILALYIVTRIVPLVKKNEINSQF
jgi:hypothetical protein